MTESASAPDCSSSDDLLQDRESAPVSGALPRLVDALPELTRRFDRHGVLGLLLIDVSIVTEIEHVEGGDAREGCMNALSSVIEEVARTRVDIDDMVVQGGIGQDEIAIVVFRGGEDGNFYRQELPALAQTINAALRGQGARALYPYRRDVPVLTTGVAMGIRNPRWSAETQMHRVLDEARHDAALNKRVEARRRRHQIVETVLDGRIHSVYEPIVNVATRTVYGYEALARGPEGALHSPLALFAMAEDEDLVFELDCLCRASGLRGAKGLPEGTALFLNVRPTTIHDPNFKADRLIKTLSTVNLSPSDVVLEISEQESIRDFSVFREIRDYYRGLGFRFALDDTGAGYAGLEALVEISPEFVKVDRAFVSGIDQDPVRRTMLSALQTMADKIGAQIIGEGLDRLEELETLGELGIEFGQGWLFGKPTPLLPENER